MKSLAIRKVVNRGVRARALGELRLPIDRNLITDVRKHNRPELVLSLTTFAPRLDGLWKTLHSLARQTVKPNRFVLFVTSQDYVQAKSHPSLSKYFDRGLELVADRGDRMSYKKLLPALSLFPESAIVTADDDVLYPRTWLRDLVNSSMDNPGRTVGHRGTEILLSGGYVGPYRSWRPASGISDPAMVFLTGMGGILYPPYSLHDDVMDWPLANTLCPSADDIWFKIMALRKGIGSVVVGRGNGDFPVSTSASIDALSSVNVAGNMNDRQMDAILSYYGYDVLLGRPGKD